MIKLKDKRIDSIYCIFKQFIIVLRKFTFIAIKHIVFNLLII